MQKLLRDLLEPEARESIRAIHSVQKAKYGVCIPPSLKQLVSLRYLLIKTGSLPDVNSEEMLGLSRVECNMLLKHLNRMYIAQRRKRRRNKTGDEVDNVKTVAR